MPILAHYAHYFKRIEKSDEMVFDWQKLRDAGRSFLDSIILELCFPRAPYSQAVLYNILHDAIEENPREARRFPQALFDAVGDLAVGLVYGIIKKHNSDWFPCQVVVQLQHMLDAPLVGPEGQKWVEAAKALEKTEDVKAWLAAQEISEAATNNFPTFKNIIFPLEKTQKADVLSNMWRLIDAVSLPPLLSVRCLLTYAPVFRTTRSLVVSTSKRFGSFKLPSKNAHPGRPRTLAT